MRNLDKDTAANVMVLMTDATDHVTGKAGLTLTITLSKDGGAFGAITPTVTERGSGWYAIALTAAHTDTLGDLALHITGSGADPSDVLLLVTDYAGTAAAIWTKALEGSLTAEAMQRIVLAALGGKRAGLGTATELYYAQDGTTPRISFAPTDAAGNGTPTLDCA